MAPEPLLCASAGFHVDPGSTRDSCRQVPPPCPFPSLFPESAGEPCGKGTHPLSQLSLAKPGFTYSPAGEEQEQFWSLPAHDQLGIAGKLSALGRGGGE